MRVRINILTRRLAVLLFSGLMAALFAVPLTHAATRTGSDSVGFGVQPLRFNIETSAGKTTTHTFSLTNTETSSSRFTFSKEDFSGDRDDPGATPVLLGGKLDSAISGYDWINIPDPITIPAGGTRTVSVKVVAPASATGGHYAALFVHGPARSAGNITATSRIGILFSMNAGNTPPPEIVITEIQEVSPNRTVTQFVNEGTTTIKRPTGTITRDPIGRNPTRTIKGECTRNVLPGAAGECVFEDNGGRSGNSSSGGLFGGDGLLGGVGPVEQYVDIVGDPGEEGMSARGELPTEWAGTWTSMLLPLVGVVLFVLYFLFLRRRSKDDEGEFDDDDDLILV